MWSISMIIRSGRLYLRLVLGIRGVCRRFGVWRWIALWGFLILMAAMLWIFRSSILHIPIHVGQAVQLVTTYTFLNSVCTKNIPTPFPIPNTNTNTTTPSNNTNTTIPNPTTPPNTYTSLSYSELAGKYLSIFMNMALSYVFSLSTIKAMPKFLLIFTVLVNDLPFYKYHRKF